MERKEILKGQQEKLQNGVNITFNHWFTAITILASYVSMPLQSPYLSYAVECHALPGHVPLQPHQGNHGGAEGGVGGAEEGEEGSQPYQDDYGGAVGGAEEGGEGPRSSHVRPPLIPARRVQLYITAATKPHAA